MEKEIKDMPSKQVNKTERNEAVEFYKMIADMPFNKLIDYQALTNDMMNIFLPKRFSLKKSLKLNPRLIIKI